MRADLENLLFASWPELYSARETPGSRMVGFEHGAGWYPVVDALSEAVDGLAREEGIPVPQAFWSKEKFGGLRWSLGDYPEEEDVRDAIFGAIGMAEACSVSICEDTGQPGASWSLGGWYRTMAVEAVRAWHEGRESARKVTATFVGLGSHSLLYRDESGARQAETWDPQDTGALVEDGQVSIPIGLTDIANTLLRTLAYGGYKQPLRRIVRALRWDGATRSLVLEFIPGTAVTPRMQGEIRTATLLARRADPETGAMAVPPAPAAS